MKLLINKVFGLSSNIHQFKEFTSDVITMTENVMAMVYEQLQDSDKKYKELRGEVTLSTAQVQFMVETIRLLTERWLHSRKMLTKKGRRIMYMLEPNYQILPLLLLDLHLKSFLWVELSLQELLNRRVELLLLCQDYQP